MRVNFNYFISDAVRRVHHRGGPARRPRRLRACCATTEFDPASGLWRHQHGPAEPPLRLSQVGFASGRLTYPVQTERAGEDALAGYLVEGARVMREAGPVEPVEAHVNADFDALRWFALPTDSLPVS